MWHPWCQTSEDAGTDTSRWLRQERNTRHRQSTSLCTTQPRQLRTNNGNRPRTSAGNWNVLTKRTAIQEIHHHGWSHIKPDCHGGGTSLPVPTNEPVGMVFTGIRTYHATESINKLRVDKQNLLRRKCGKNNGALWTHGNPFLINQTIVKG